jgi:hypothetical protein
MKPGKARFKRQIQKIKALFEQANTHENPALWLFLHDLRTPLFMLEGLSKLYSDFHNKKIFTNLREKFKQLEDALGAVDYYASFQKELSVDPQLPAAVIGYFQQKTIEETSNLQKILKKQDWLNGKKIKAIEEKLDKLKWRDEKVEKVFLQKYYQNETIKIAQFVNETGFPFVNIEEDVHELRRKLRWLSIYPQALNGVVFLKEIKPVPQYLEKYLTDDILKSPFNVMPVSSEISSKITIDKNKFLALSSMIAQLGYLKDKGLKINALKNGFQATLLLKDDVAYHETYKYLGKNYPTLDKIVSKASEIAKQYFSENNLNFVLDL